VKSTAAVKEAKGERQRWGLSLPPSTAVPVLVSEEESESLCACGGGCPRCRGKLPVQTKLTVGEPGDEYEREADRAAEMVMRIPDPNRAAPFVQRRMAAATTGIGEPPPIVREVLASPGRPLDTRTRAFFEPRFGHDFDHVRVHTDVSAARSALVLRAKAYTVGHHIAFAAGRFAPESCEGRRLLAHELAHAVQQGAGGSDCVLQRQSDVAQKVIESHQSLFGTQLDEIGLGNDLRSLVLGSDKSIDLVMRVFDELPTGDRDEVAYNFVRPLDDSELMQLAESERGQTLLTRLEVEMTGGFEWPQEKTEREPIHGALAAVTTPFDLSSIDLGATGLPDTAEAQRHAAPFGTPAAPSSVTAAVPFPSEGVGDYEFASVIGRDLWARLQVVWASIGISRLGAVQLLVQFLETLDDINAAFGRAATYKTVFDALTDEVRYTLDLLWEIDYDDPFLHERFATIGGYLRDLDSFLYDAEEGAREEQDAGRLQLFISGFTAGVRSLDQSLVSRFTERLEAVFIRDYPLLGKVYFQVGILWGVVENASEVLKVIFDLMTPEGAAPHEQALRDAVAAMTDLAEEMLGPSAGQVAYAIGYGIGAQIPEEIAQLNKISSDLDFASALGRKIGPIVVGVILSLLGFWNFFTGKVVAAAKMIGENVLDAFASVKKLWNLLPGAGPPAAQVAEVAAAEAKGVVTGVVATGRPRMSVDEMVSMMRDYKARGQPVLYHRTRQENVAANSIIRPETTPELKTNPGTEEQIFFMEGRWKMESKDYGRYFVFLEDRDIGDFNLQRSLRAKEEWVTYSSLPADRGRWATHEDVLKALERLQLR
jgi:hypothetical protein